MDGNTVDLAALLAADAAALSHDGRLSRLAALDVLESRVAAEKLKTLAMIEVDPPVRGAIEVIGDKQYVREEVAAVLRLAPSTARQRLADAVDLCHELEDTVSQLAVGAISPMQARALLDLTRDVSTAVRAKVQDRVLPTAGRKTISEFRQVVRRAVLSLDRRNQQDKHRSSAKNRGVWMRPDEHGMAWVNVFTTAPDAASIMTAVQARSDRTKIMNRRKAGAGHDLDERSPDQRRVDALVELCLADLAGNDTTWQGRKPAVQVTIAASTVFGLDDQPAELAGYGPIAAHLGRQLAADVTGSWRWVMHDERGCVIDISADSYRPPAGLRDFILARDRTCRFPGCGRLAVHSEIDHIQDRAKGGPTSKDNLEGGCLRHHHLKHEAGWTVHRTDDGTTVWIAPTGRRHEKPPDVIPLDTTSQPPPDDDDDKPPF